MRNLLSPLVLIRPIGFLCTALTALAVALGHGVADPDKDRLFLPARYYGNNGYLFANGDSTPRLLDAETGALTRLGVERTGRLEYVSLSPWRDGAGQSRLVGLWEDIQGTVSGPMSRSIGIARYTFPEGRELDRMPLEVIPTSVPCWYPGLSSRLLFAAADGHLYRFSFDDEEGRSGLEDDCRRPRALEWQAAVPGAGGVQIGDTIWPSEPGFAHTLIASLSYLESGRKVATTSPTQLWWLRLNADGTAIEAAGRLTPGDSSAEERWPALTTVPGGGQALAYLARESGEGRWQLRLTRVDRDPTTGVPHVGIVRDVLPGADCLTTSPVFSYDGLWLNVLIRDGKHSTRVERLHPAGLLADSATAVAAAAALNTP